jgi:hypothetical protein
VHDPMHIESEVQQQSICATAAAQLGSRPHCGPAGRAATLEARPVM